jgi:hypothetical protein
MLQNWFEHPKSLTCIQCDPLNETIQKCAFALHAKCLKLYADFLDGEQIFQPNTKLVQTTKSCPRTNNRLERLMTQIDRSKKKAPNCDDDHREAKIMFSENNTSEWLSQKAEEEKNSIIVNAKQLINVIERTK